MIKNFLRFTCVTFILISALNISPLYAKDRISAIEKNKKMMRNFFSEVVETKEFSRDKIRLYFGPDHTHHINGKEKLNQEQLIAHIKLLKENTKSIKAKIISMTAEGDNIVVNYELHYVTHENKKIIIKIIGEFRIKNNRIYYCDEVTALIKGDPEDAELASKH